MGESYAKAEVAGMKVVKGTDFRGTIDQLEQGGCG